MKIIQAVHATEKSAWDTYVREHPGSYHFHLSGWKAVIETVYGHRGYYLMAVAPGASGKTEVQGVLPLILFKCHFRHKRLISMPFLDTAGILASDPAAENALLAEALCLANRLGAESLELRQPRPLAALERQKIRPAAYDWFELYCLSHKDGLRRKLPPAADLLFDSFKSKLRSQIRKALKNGLERMPAGRNFLDEFYDVFSTNMRDLGSPVHSKTFFRQILQRFPEDAYLLTIRAAQKPVAAGFVLRHGDTLYNPWASSLRKYRPRNANMLLYWSMLANASDRQVRHFDFGRSTRGAGTYRFKRQWGAQAAPLAWYYFYFDKRHRDPLQETLELWWWKNFPVPVSRIIGPWLRKQIAL